MPDYIMQPGYTGPSPSQLTQKNVLLQVNNGLLAVSRPTGSGVDRSILAGTTSQTLMGANTARMGLFVKNDSTVDVWINIGAAASASPGSGNIKVPANGGYFESGTFTPAEAISIIAASGSPAITAREF